MYRYIQINALIAVVFIISGCSIDCQNICSRKISFNNQNANGIKVMTFNVRVNTMIDGANRWNRRNQIVFDTIASNKADVFGLQEAKPTQIQQIQQALPQYSNYAAGRNNGKSKGESCAIFYRKDRFLVINSGTFWFSDTPSIPGSKDWGNLFPRICSWVHLVNKPRKAGFYVYNVHLDNFSQNSRKKSILLLANIIANRKRDDPFIIMGDFNMEVDNPAIVSLQRINCRLYSVRTYDVWSLIYPDSQNVGTRHGFSGKIDGPQIDHIRISEQAQAIKAKIDRYNVDGRYPSDHFPVVATIHFDYPIFANQTDRTMRSDINRSKYLGSDI